MSGCGDVSLRQNDLILDIQGIFIMRWNEVKDYFRMFTKCSLRSYIREYVMMRHDFPQYPSRRFTWMDGELKEVSIVYTLTDEDQQWLTHLEGSLTDYGNMGNEAIGNFIDCGDDFMNHMEIFRRINDSQLGWMCFDEIIQMVNETMISYRDFHLNQNRNLHVLKKCILFLDQVILPWICSIFHKRDCKKEKKKG
jgi:hypothetical protein